MSDHVDNPFQSPATLSICTGIGGLERGVERVTGPLRTIAYVEIEAFIIENLLAGMEAGILDPAPVWANLKTFPWEQFRGKVGLLMGGYPCQPFSTAGLRKGKDDPRHLWPHIERGIRTIRPLCCFFENVAGHLSLGFEQVADSLRAMGYAVEAGIYTAEEVGAPHKRARLFILAILADAKHSERRTFDRWRDGAYTRQSTLHRKGPENTGGFTERGPALANAVSNGAGAAAGDTRRQGEEDEGEMERQGREGLFGERSRGYPRDSGATGISVADSGSAGLEERRKQPARQEFEAAQRGGSSLAHPNSSGQQAIRNNGKSAQEGNNRTFYAGDIDRWPAGPGQQQYEWEEPRTVITQQAALLLGGYGKKHPEGFPAWQIEQVALDGFAGTIEPRLDCSINGYNFREDLLRALGNGVIEQTAELAFRDLMRKHFE